MKSRITVSFARLLRSALVEEVNAASFSSNKKLLDQFLQDGVLDFRLIGNQQRKIFCLNADNLAKYLHNKFGIPALDEYISFLERDEVQRSDAAKAVSDTKFRKTSVFTGFLLNCYGEMGCMLYSEIFTLKPAVGAFTFVSAYKHFTIPHHVTVVVVENHENFREIVRQRYLFDTITPLFVWRYQNSSSIVDWLKRIPNPYIHFGDFDPKGIHIYLSEFKSKLDAARCRMLIPEDIEPLLVAHGEKDLYENQKKLIPLIRSSNDPDVQSLTELLIRHKKGLAQEILIR